MRHLIDPERKVPRKTLILVAIGLLLISLSVPFAIVTAIYESYPASVASSLLLTLGLLLTYNAVDDD